MKFLIIGCGGREYAIIKSLKNTIETSNDVYCVGDYVNHGIKSLIGANNYKVIDYHVYEKLYSLLILLYPE